MSPVVAADAYTELAPEIRETGAVRCPDRLGAGIARARCIELQHELRCGARCATGRVAQVVDAELAQEELEDERRAAGARRERAGENRTWALVCAYCGDRFEAERGYHRKPRYCPEPATCRLDANRERKRVAAGGRRA